jgi:hypothetical protein
MNPGLECLLSLCNAADDGKTQVTCADLQSL